MCYTHLTNRKSVLLIRRYFTMKVFLSYRSAFGAVIQSNCLQIMPYGQTYKEDFAYGKQITGVFSNDSDKGIYYGTD